jgi:2,4-dienoyl-CoA reductase-like NADH-dependent reductase (Old Yellow Enzyme family)
MMMALLFEPLTIKDITFKNRIAVSPMCEYSSIDGFANDWHLVHLGSRAVGGAGLILAEATAVSPEGRITPDDLGLWKEEHIPFLKRITDFIAAHGSVAGVQLAHAGRKASHSSQWKGNKSLKKDEGSWTTFSASAIPYKPEEPVPVEMSITDIDKVVNDFEIATERSLRAGFKVIEIHAAHGYLIHQFLSPLSNKRRDEYGGSFENRIRFLVRITEAIKKVTGGSLPLFVRISATDWVENGWDENDSVALAKILKDKGVDLIDCSSGGNSPEQKITVGPLYQVPFSEKIRKEATIATGAVGMINTAEEAEEILQKKQADIILMAREFLRDPYFPLHAAYLLNVDVEWPIQYVRAKK